MNPNRNLRAPRSLSISEASYILNDDDFYTVPRNIETLFEAFEKSFDSPDTNVRGKALENLACALMNGVHCFKAIPDVETHTNQIDVFVKVRGITVNHKFLSMLNDSLVCECKNESRNVTTREVNEFAGLIQQKSTSGIGVLFSRRPISGTPTKYGQLAQRDWARKNIFVVSITYEDLSKLRAGANLVTMLQDKYLALRIDAQGPLSTDTTYDLARPPEFELGT